MNKQPVADTDIVSCPHCGKLCNRALTNQTDGILWCSCGKIYLLSICNFSVVEYELLKVALPWER